jgi:hypothetical protein
MDTIEEIQRRIEDALSKAKASMREDVRREWFEIAEQWANLATGQLQRDDEVNREMIGYEDTATGTVGMSSEELRSERAVRYLDNAANALARAKSASDPKVRDLYLRLAAAWERLAVRDDWAEQLDWLKKD